MAKTVSSKTPLPGDRLAGLWRKRYRHGLSPADFQINATIEAIMSHRTVRSYLPQALPAGALELGLAAAQSAPTSSNLQAWDVVVVKEPARKMRLSKLAGDQRHIVEAPVLLVWLANLSRMRSIAAHRNHTSDGLDYLESFMLGVIDAALAAQNALVAFESLGFGTCYIGALRNHADQVARELELPPEAVAVFGMTVGIPDADVQTEVKPRLPQAIVVHEERYRQTSMEEFEAYDERMDGFQREQRMPLVDWTEQVARRIGTVEALRNRDKLRLALKDMHFKLC